MMNEQTKGAAKLAGWRKRLAQGGGRIITTGLSVEAVHALECLKANGASTRQAIERALVKAAQGVQS